MGCGQAEEVKGQAGQHWAGTGCSWAHERHPDFSVLQSRPLFFPFLPSFTPSSLLPSHPSPILHRPLL